jgi:hypothetical protein
LLDRIDYILSPQDGLLAVVDFYTAGKQPSLHEKAIGGTSKECGWLSRWFWQIWFDFDHVCGTPWAFASSVDFSQQVSLSPARRSYLEYKFGTVSRKSSPPFIARLDPHFSRSKVTMAETDLSFLSSLECSSIADPFLPVLTDLSNIK